MKKTIYFMGVCVVVVAIMLIGTTYSIMTDGSEEVSKVNVGNVAEPSECFITEIKDKVFNLKSDDDYKEVEFKVRNTCSYENKYDVEVKDMSGADLIKVSIDANDVKELSKFEKLSNGNYKLTSGWVLANTEVSYKLRIEKDSEVNYSGEIVITKK